MIIVEATDSPQCAQSQFTVHSGNITVNLAPYSRENPGKQLPVTGTSHCPKSPWHLPQVILSGRHPPSNLLNNLQPVYHKHLLELCKVSSTASTTVS